MIDVKLKGINTVRKRLASGEIRTYYFHRATNTRLHGEPYSPEFLQKYAEAEKRVQNHKSVHRNDGTLKSLIQRYMESPMYRDKSPRTRKDYQRQIVKIEEAFGEMPIEVLSDQHIRSDFLDWRDKLAQSSKKQADYAITVLGRVLAWSVDRGLIAQNYAARPGKLYKSDRASIVWSDADIAAFIAVASPELQLALIMGRDTGQRQGDLLRLLWSAYDGEYIHLTQSKTAAKVEVPVTRELKAMLDDVKRSRTNLTVQAPTILTRPDGRAWKADNFRHHWRAATLAAGLDGKRFQDLRGTTVTALADAGCTPIQIASITGHSIRSVESILEHYLARTRTQADAAIHKLETAKTANQIANRKKKGARNNG